MRDRKVNESLSWRIPLQHMGGDSAGLARKLGSPDSLRFAMILGTAELDAPLLSERMYLGLGWLGPATVYPPHAHQAREVYHVLKGNTD